MEDCGDRTPVIAGRTVHGPPTCGGNAPEPSNLDVPNDVSGPATGQCAEL